MTTGLLAEASNGANDELISDEPSPKRLAANDSPSVKCDSS
jgi:hypothetical protein